MPVITKTTRKTLRRNRIRSHVSGTSSRPRLSIFRGLKTCFVQLIDDTKGVTVASASERELPKGKHSKSERARMLGTLIAEKGRAFGVSAVVFDRGGNRYHGRVKEVAEGAREGGLEF